MKFIWSIPLLLLSLVITVGCSTKQKHSDESLGAAVVLQWDKTTYVLTNGTVSSDNIGEKLGEIKQGTVNRINCLECAPPNLVKDELVFEIKGFDIKERIAVKQHGGYFVLKNKEIMLQEKQK